VQDFWGYLSFQNIEEQDFWPLMFTLLEISQLPNYSDLASF